MINISFDFDGTLTDTHIRVLAEILLLVPQVQVFIITSRMEKFGKDVYDLAKILKIPKERVCFTNNTPKATFIKTFKESIYIHFDDDFFEIQQINNETSTKGILVDLYN